MIFIIIGLLALVAVGFALTLVENLRQHVTERSNSLANLTAGLAQMLKDHAADHAHENQDSANSEGNMAKFTYAVGYYAAQKLCEEVKDPKAVSSLSELADKVGVCMNNNISTDVIKTMVDRILALR